jgi:hypothetical protein
MIIFFFLKSTHISSNYYPNIVNVSPKLLIVSIFSLSYQKISMSLKTNKKIKMIIIFNKNVLITPSNYHLIINVPPPKLPILSTPPLNYRKMSMFPLMTKIPFMKLFNLKKKLLKNMK